MDLRWIDSAFSQHKEWRYIYIWDIIMEIYIYIWGIIISTMEMGSFQCALRVPFIVIRELIDLTHLQGSSHK